MKKERDNVVPMVKARHDFPWRLSRGAPKEVIVRGELNAGHGPTTPGLFDTPEGHRDNSFPDAALKISTKPLVRRAWCVLLVVTHEGK
jgi:hypothetical protein